MNERKKPANERKKPANEARRAGEKPKNPPPKAQTQPKNTRMLTKHTQPRAFPISSPQRLPEHARRPASGREDIEITKPGEQIQDSMGGGALRVCVAGVSERRRALSDASGGAGGRAGEGEGGRNKELHSALTFRLGRTMLGETFRKRIKRIA